MKINMSIMTDAELAKLIRAASTELAERLASEQNIKRIPAAERTIELRVPPEDDKDFALYIKGLLQKGSYIKAGERARIAEIAQEYPEWISRQGLPSEKGTGPWRAAQQSMSVARPRER